MQKHFVAENCHTKPLQLRSIGIKALRTHGKTSSHIKKKVEANKGQSSLSKSFEASASNKVLHQKTFTILSYQVKEATILLAVHSILTHTTKKQWKIDKSVVSLQ